MAWNWSNDQKLQSAILVVSLTGLPNAAKVTKLHVGHGVVHVELLSLVGRNLQGL